MKKAIKSLTPFTIFCYLLLFLAICSGRNDVMVDVFIFYFGIAFGLGMDLYERRKFDEKYG